MNPICHRCRRTNPVMYTHGMGLYLCITCRWADSRHPPGRPHAIPDRPAEPMKPLFTGTVEEQYSTLLAIQQADVRNATWSRKYDERTMAPADKLDDIGWRIFDVAIRLGMNTEEAAEAAMDGTEDERVDVLQDMWRSQIRHMRHHFPGFADTPTDADDRLAYWLKHLPEPQFVYFIQFGEAGPVKIGRAKDPRKRLATLQTSSPVDLHIREVVPGDAATETMLHKRFAEARTRGEWFDGEYLPLILLYADALAQEAIDAHDGGPHAPMVVDGGTAIRRGDASSGVRREIERLWADGHSINDIAHFLAMTPAEITEHMRVMRASTLYTTRRTLTPTQRALREATTPREHE